MQDNRDDQNGSATDSSSLHSEQSTQAENNTILWVESVSGRYLKVHRMVACQIS